MKPPSGRRALIVLPATIAGTCSCPTWPTPVPTWIRLRGLCRRLTPPAVTRRYRFAVSAIVREPDGPRPAGRVRALLRRWRERAYFHLSRDEHDARTQIGMPCGTPNVSPTTSKAPSWPWTAANAARTPPSGTTWKPGCGRTANGWAS